jgi:enoyl-[acyl-carrier protein] reductase II
MLRTPVCDLLGIEVPVVQGAIAPFTSPELVAAVCAAGGLGSLGTALWPAADVQRALARTRELTDRPFAVNFTHNTFDEAAFALVLAARPRVVSFALGFVADRVRRAHAAGCLVLQQVHTARQAAEAAAGGADVLIAQGDEAGGFGGPVGLMALLPQVVDAVRPRPVLAAGGIADGRGLAAALVLGAQGVNLGTRFLACEETPIGDGWKQAIVAAQSEDTARVAFVNAVFPPAPGAYPTAPRTLRTPFVARWEGVPEQARQEAARLRAEVAAAVRERRMHEVLPITGQSAGLIRDSLPAAEIVRRLMAEAEAALEGVAAWRAGAAPEGEEAGLRHRAAGP